MLGFTTIPGFSHRFTSFRFVFAVDFGILDLPLIFLELHKGFIWIELADNIMLKVCCLHRIWILLFAAIALHRIFVLLDFLLGHLGFHLLELGKGIIVELRLKSSRSFKYCLKFRLFNSCVFALRFCYCVSLFCRGTITGLIQKESTRS